MGKVFLFLFLSAEDAVEQRDMTDLEGKTAGRADSGVERAEGDSWERVGLVGMYYRSWEQWYLPVAASLWGCFERLILL